MFAIIRREQNNRLYGPSAFRSRVIRQDLRQSGMCSRNPGLPGMLRHGLCNVTDTWLPVMENRRTMSRTLSKYR